MKRRRQELVVFAALLLVVSAAAAPAETAVSSPVANTTAPVPAPATNTTAAAPQPPVVSTSNNVTINIPPLPKFIPKAVEASPVPLVNVTYLQKNPLTPYNEAGIHKNAEYGAPMPRVPPKTMKDIGVQGKCVAWGSPASVHTFDGRGYSFQGHGEFIFFNSTEETIHVLQHRNQLISFNTGVALRTLNETFSMHLKKHVHNNSAPTFSPEFRWNQREVTSGVLAEPRVKVGRFFVHHSGRFDTDGALPLTVTATSANGSTVSAYFTRCGKHVHLNLFIEVPSNNFETASGLCGNFNLLPDDDFAGPGDSELATPFEFATAWAVTKPADSLWADQKLITRDNVLQSAITPQSIGSTKAQVLNASLACANVVPSFRAACIFNVLTCGTKAAADASRVEKVSLENGVIPANASTCMEGNWTLGAWGEWGNCSATCGTGTRSRDRQMFVTNPNGTTSVCTNLTQVEDCVSPCEKAKVWGKCSAFGYVQSFDGNVYVTPCTGEYLLYQSLDMAQQVNILQRFLPNSTLPIPSGVAFRSGPDVFSISLTGPEFSSPRFVYNSHEVISISKGAPVPFGLFSVTRIGDIYPDHNRNLIYEIRTSGGTTVTVSFEIVEMTSGQLVDRLTAFVEVTGDQIGNTKGQCGSFDYNKENDFVSNNGARLTPGQFGWQQFVIAKDTLFLPVGHIPASCPVNSTLSQITPQSIQGADPVKIAGAKEACRDGVASVPMQDACVTFYLVAGPAGLKSVAAPAAVIESSSTQVDAKTTVACLATPGVTLGPWGWWTDCSADCGLGKKLRSRAVNRLDGTKCGDVVQTSSCIKRKCPVDCKVSAWSEWSKCNVECGEGVKSRSRAVLVKAENGGTACPFLTESKKCKVTAGCCVFGEWSRWTKCVKGTQKRLRTVSPKPSCGASQETRPCCDISPWSEWSKCDNGIQQRNREVYGPVSCGKKHQVRQCCSKGKWSKWSKCKNGTQFRTRKVVGPANCAKNQDVRECCSVGKWFKWTKCDPKTRTRFRVRTVIGPKGCAPTVQKETCPAWELAMLFPAKKPKVHNATKEFPTLHAKMHFSSTQIIPIPETAAAPLPDPVPAPAPSMAAESAPLAAPPVTPQPQQIVPPCVPQPCTTTVNCVPVVCPLHPADAGVVPPPLTGRIITPVPLTPAQTI